MLIRELVDLATSDTSSVVLLLRKCMVLGYKLKNQALVDWAKGELQGYGEETTLPNYRIAHVGAKGTLVGGFGARVSNYPIPSIMLEEKHREWATTVELREPISSLEELMRSDSPTFKRDWPSDLTLYYQNKIVTQNGCHLVHAWQDLSRSIIAHILDAVKNRTLAMALELQTSMGEEDSIGEITPQIAAEISKTVTNNIYGGINVIASGDSSVTSSVSHSQNVLTANDFDALKRLLQDGGLSNEDVQELNESMKEDGPKQFGARTKEWIKNTGSKLLVGGVHVSSAVAQAVATEYLKQHFGLTHM